MDTSKEWTIFFCLVVLVVGLVCINLTNKMTANTHFALERGYTLQSLPGLDYPQWVKNN